LFAVSHFHFFSFYHSNLIVVVSMPLPRSASSKKKVGCRVYSFLNNSRPMKFSRLTGYIPFYKVISTLPDTGTLSSLTLRVFF
jgi:hypothetical protein